MEDDVSALCILPFNNTTERHGFPPNIDPQTAICRPQGESPVPFVDVQSQAGLLDGGREGCVWGGKFVQTTYDMLCDVI